MQIDIKNEVLTSYRKLISDCKKSIDRNIDVEKNLALIKEYSNILYRVSMKPKSSYEAVEEEILKAAKIAKENKLSKFSNKV